MARYLPKTLAKTISYISCYAPSEHGLFWNPDGTMPWKELFWALQEDPSLRFVREVHIREISYLGIELPFTMEEGVLRLGSEIGAPEYPVESEPPERLFYACRRKEYPSVLKYGLKASNRPYLGLCSAKGLAVRIGKRRDPEPIVVEILARKAASGGITIRKAGEEMFLAEAIPLELLVCPPMREEELASLAAMGKKDKKPKEAPASATPGSFLMGADQLNAAYGVKGAAGRGERKGGGRGENWKKSSRKERGKRIP